MSIDSLTLAAVRHTLHCLAGCAVGEVLGMAIGTALEWHDAPTIALAIVLAFFFGYLFTMYSLMKKGAMKLNAAVKIALGTDTVSITSMEIVDNLMLIIIPGALAATLSTGLFWLSLAVALFVAFWVTVPVNRWFIARTNHSHHH